MIKSSERTNRNCFFFRAMLPSSPASGPLTTLTCRPPVPHGSQRWMPRTSAAQGTPPASTNSAGTPLFQLLHSMPCLPPCSAWPRLLQLPAPHTPQNKDRRQLRPVTHSVIVALTSYNTISYRRNRYLPLLRRIAFAPKPARD